VQAVLAAIHTDRREFKRQEYREEGQQHDYEVGERPREFGIRKHVHTEHVEEHILGFGTVRHVVRRHCFGEREQVFTRVLQHGRFDLI